MGAINSRDRIAAPLCSLGTWFVSGIYIYIHTLHKGDSDDNRVGCLPVLSTFVSC
jgi:hypothetical protein